MKTSGRLKPAGLLAAIGLALLCGADPALAFSFNISPISLSLSGKRPSALLTLKSNSAEPVRIQIKVYAWSEAPDGTAKLEPTDDLLVFPPIATLAPGATRAIRVGAAAPAGADERSYRVYVEEMPPEESTPKPGEVRVLSRFALAVFVAPVTGSPELQLQSLDVKDGSLNLSIGNAGNVHAKVRTVTVRTLDAKGLAIDTREVEGWYVLAGGRRGYTVPLDAAACRGASSVSVAIASDGGNVDGAAKVPAGGCRP